MKSTQKIVFLILALLTFSAYAASYRVEIRQQDRPLRDFLDAVFVDVLGENYALAHEDLSKDCMVTLKGTFTRSRLLSATQAILRANGLRHYSGPGSVHVITSLADSIYSGLIEVDTSLQLSEVDPATLSLSKFPGTSFDSRSRKVFYTGTAKGLSRLQKYLAQVDVLKPSYRVELIVTEIHRDTNSSRDVSMLLGLVGSVASHDYGLQVDGDVIDLRGTSTRGIDIMGSVRAGWSFSDSRIKVISSPYILVRDGHKTTLQVGQQVPVIKGSFQGESGYREDFEYQQTGITLSLSIAKLPSGLLRLSLAQTTSSVIQSALSSRGAPVLDNRSLSTEIDLAPGSMMNIAGMTSNTIDSTITGIPWLRSLPWIGKVFEGSIYQKRKVEYMVTAVIREKWARTFETTGE